MSEVWRCPVEPIRHSAVISGAEQVQEEGRGMTERRKEGRMMKVEEGFCERDSLGKGVAFGGGGSSNYRVNRQAVYASPLR